MRYRRWCGAVLLAATAAMVLHGCAWPWKKKQPSAIIAVALFDTSGSASGMRDSYISAFEKSIAGRLAGGCGDPRSALPRESRAAHGVAYVISQNSQATAYTRKEASFTASKGWLGSSMDEDDRRRKARDSFLTEVKEMVSKSSADKYTDIMSAMYLAGKEFTGHKDYKHKLLIVFSDMVEQTRYHDFATEQLTAARISQIIEREKNSHRLPALRGVRVWVAGAGAKREGGMDTQRIQQIQDFWLAYFKAAGADVDESRYAPTLINFDIPAN